MHWRVRATGGHPRPARTACPVTHVRALEPELHGLRTRRRSSRPIELTARSPTPSRTAAPRRAPTAYARAFVWSGNRPSTERGAALPRRRLHRQRLRQPRLHGRDRRSSPTSPAPHPARSSLPTNSAELDSALTHDRSSDAPGRRTRLTHADFDQLMSRTSSIAPAKPTAKSVARHDGTSWRSSIPTVVGAPVDLWDTRLAVERLLLDGRPGRAQTPRIADSLTCDTRAAAGRLRGGSRAAVRHLEPSRRVTAVNERRLRDRLSAARPPHLRVAHGEVLRRAARRVDAGRRASSYEVQWSRKLYPFRAAATTYTFPPRRPCCRSSREPGTTACAASTTTCRRARQRDGVVEADQDHRRRTAASASRRSRPSRGANRSFVDRIAA